LATSGIKPRFLSKVRKTPTCWLWVGATRGPGYGAFGVKREGKWLQHLAHRIAWQLFKGPIPPAKCVLHRCDNRACVNPKHLFLGTFQDNTDDMLRKGRFTPARGSDQGSAVLVEERIVDIFMLHQNGWTQKAIGQQFGISQQGISDVLRRKTWRHVSV